MTPHVSVIMPAYNAAPFLSLSIESILRQSYKDFELIVLDDGSTDATPAILQRYISEPRLRVVRQPNQGVVATLNRGLEFATAELVARMDADDIASPVRLEQQVEFMSDHPKVGILGTAYRIIDAAGRDWGKQPVPTNDLSIRWTSLLNSPFVHPSVMMRRSILQQHSLSYSTHAEAVEDYDLFSRLLGYCEGANLAEPLLDYRVHGLSNTGRVAKLQLGNNLGVALRQMRRVLPDFAPPGAQMDQLHHVFFTRGVSLDTDRRRADLAALYLDLWEAFVRHAASKANPNHLKSLERQVILKAAHMVMRPPLPPGWRHVIRRLTSMDAAWPIWFVAALPQSTVLNLRWRSARHLFVRHHAR
jgi:glycosyltransferase involved in cell wall biosynthesis